MSTIECVRPGSKSPAPAATPTSAERFRFVVAKTADDLLTRRAEWEDLARAAADPNVFLEPWFVLAALSAFQPASPLSFVLLYEQTGPGRRLVGFFPLVVTRGYKGLPARCATLWQHPYAMYGAPLLRAGVEEDCLAAFLDWAGTGPLGCSLVHLPLFPGSGPVQHALAAHCQRTGRLMFVDECYPRALFLPRAEEYRQRASSTRSLKEQRRRERRLAETGRLEYRQLTDAGDVSHWTEAFLELESGGWKGAQGTAFASREPDRAFFRAILHEAFTHGQLHMLGLFLDGRAIALKCNLRAGDGAFAFKIAYDETLSKYSPGVQLELHNMDVLHAQSEIRWMDSCAIFGHPMIDKLWIDRRVVQHVALSTGRAPGDLVVSLLPGLRWLRRKLSFRRTKTTHPVPKEDTP
jgi:CelD/BcsL family acetyltransferase involved in cellulose biosynthesis